MRVSNESTKGLEQSRESAKSSRTGEVRGKASDRKAGKTSDAKQIESNDKVELSNKGRDVAKAKSAALSAPDVNQEKVDRIKKSIASGTYSVDAEKVADRLVDEHMSTMF